MKKLIATTFLAISVLAMPQTALANTTSTGVTFGGIVVPSPVIAPIPTSAGQMLPFSKGRFILAHVSNDQHTLRLSFIGFADVNTLNYFLKYDTNEVAQGVVGTIVPNGQRIIKREIVLGTCSQVCAMHYDISNMTLEVTVEKSGRTYTKTFSIKI